MSSRYDVLNEVGSGGMGIVYQARDRETGTVVALKVLHPEIAGRGDLIERFKTELVLARKITHKNVCRVYDLNRFDNVIAISMEYIEGESLRSLLNRVDGLSIHHGLRVLQQVIAGLAEAHAQGVVHRDLKPENIFIARDGTVKVMDFGIARSVDSGATLTGTITGTPAYMSPEQAEGKTADARSDIYALGLVMYEMFCGRRAFTGETPIAVAMKQIQEMPPQPREFEPYLPSFLERAILKCIEKKPAKRFQSVNELETALIDRQESGTVVAESEVAEPPMPVHLAHWQRSDWLFLPLAVVGVLLFFSFFQRTSLATRNQVSFDRSVLRRIAQEYAQRLGAPIGQQSEINVGGSLGRYSYVAESAGAPAALELTNNPVPYLVWEVKWENGTEVVVDNRGALQTFYPDLRSAASVEKLSIQEAQNLGEKAIREFFNRDASTVRLDAAGDRSYLGRTIQSFTWSDPADYHGLHRTYSAGFFGKQIAYLVVGFDVPPGYESSDIMWQILPVLALDLVLIFLGITQRHLVNLRARWRIFTVAGATVAAAWFMGQTVPIPLEVGAPTRIFISVLLGISIALVMYFLLVPFERAVRRMGPAKLSTVVRLFDRRAISEPCGLGILRGALIGLALLGVDAFLVWLGTSRLGMRLDMFSQLYLQARVFLNSSWTSFPVLLMSVFHGVGIAVYLSLLTAMVARVVSRPWLALFLAAAAAAVIFPGPIFMMGAVQPYPSKVLLLFFDFLILAWTFTRFDVLTLFMAGSTFAFFWENYSLLVMFRPTGALEEWVCFALWALVVAAAAVVAFQSSIAAAYRRLAITFE